MGLFRSFKNFLFGKKRKVEQLPRFTPEQQNALDNLLRQGMSNVDTSALEERARGQFMENTVPGIAERFTAMGGGQRSSAFQGALGRAGSDLESQLAVLKNQAGMQKLQLGLQPQFDTAITPGTPGMLEGLLGPAFSLIGTRVLGGDRKNQALNTGVGPQYYPGQPQGYTGNSINPALLKLLSGLIF